MSRRYREDEEWEEPERKPSFEEEVEMCLGGVEERGGTSASPRQAAHEWRVLKTRR